MMPIEFLNKTFDTVCAIISGIISGLLATYIFRRKTRKIERTNILISNQIARSPKIKYKYSIKISNETPQDAYDVRVYIRLRYKGKYLIIKPKNLPILHGRNGLHRPYDYQRKFSFSLSNFNAKTIDDLNESKIIELYKNEKLEFSDFARFDTIVEIVVMSIDSISGGVMDVKTKTFSYDELKINVVTGIFNKDTLEVMPYDDSEPEEVDNDNY